MTRARGFPRSRRKRIPGWCCRCCEGGGEPSRGFLSGKFRSAASSLSLSSVCCCSSLPIAATRIFRFSPPLCCRKRKGGSTTSRPSSTQLIDRQFVWLSIVGMTDRSVTHYWWQKVVTIRYKLTQQPIYPFRPHLCGLFSDSIEIKGVSREGLNYLRERGDRASRSPWQSARPWH